MDHQAFAQMLGNYGEFVGAFAVVATLGYLAVQTRQNTHALRTASFHAVVAGVDRVLRRSKASDCREEAASCGATWNVSV